MVLNLIDALGAFENRMTQLVVILVIAAVAVVDGARLPAPTLLPDASHGLGCRERSDRGSEVVVRIVPEMHGAFADRFPDRCGVGVEHGAHEAA
jgi:hypothetical protein